MKKRSDRSTVGRMPERASYDTDLIYAILDGTFICHIGFVTPHGPVVIPTIHARAGDTIYIHGAHASRMMRSIPDTQVSVAATIVDGIVVARSAFHHSLNYRSVVVFGTPRDVTDAQERMTALAAITDHVLPGRWQEARQPNEKEYRATKLLAIEIDEASAKVRSGPPGDDLDDMALDLWAGVIPLATVPGTPEPAPGLRPGIAVPPSVNGYTG